MQETVQGLLCASQPLLRVEGSWALCTSEDPGAAGDVRWGTGDGGGGGWGLNPPFPGLAAPGLSPGASSLGPSGPPAQFRQPSLSHPLTPTPTPRAGLGLFPLPPVPNSLLLGALSDPQSELSSPRISHFSLGEQAQHSLETFKLQMQTIGPP